MPTGQAPVKTALIAGGQPVEPPLDLLLRRDVDRDITFNDRRRLGPMDKVSQRIMRGPSPFTPAEREIMAAYVSGLNACAFCAGSHQAVATQFGVAPDLFDQLLTDVNTAPIREPLKPIFQYLRKLTLTPSKLVRADVERVLAAGWSEEALHQASHYGLNTVPVIDAQEQIVGIVTADDLDGRTFVATSFDPDQTAARPDV